MNRQQSTHRSSEPLHARERSQQITPTSDPSNPSTQPIRILHLEDNLLDAELIKIEILRRLPDVLIRHVQTGDEYEHELHCGNYDVILSDYRIPRYDGDLALAFAHEHCPEIPFIMVTGELGEEFVIKRLKQGATDYVLKDNVRRLAPAIEHAVHEAKEHRERKRAEKELLGSQALLSAFFTNSPVAEIIYDEENRYVRLNEYAANLYGITYAHAIGKSIYDVLTPELAKATEERNREVLQKGKPVSTGIYPALLPLGSPDAKMRYFHGTRFPVPLEGGRTGVGVVTMDITEQIEAQERSRLSEEKFSKAFHGNVAPMVITRLSDGLVIDANELYLSTLGFRREEMVGKLSTPSFIWAHPEERKDYIRDLTQAERIHNRELRLRKRNGEDWTALVSSELTTLQGEQVLISSVLDITEQKRSEQHLLQALAEAEEGRNTLRALMEYIPLGITIADAPEVNIRMVSKYGQDILERAESEIAHIPAPEHPSVWGVYHADGITPGTPEELPLTRATVQGEVVKNEEWIVTRKDGTLVPILCNAAPIKDETERVVGGVIGWQDITEQRLAREALRESEERLSLAVEATGVGMFDYHPQTGELVWSALAKRHFGLPPDAHIDYDVFLKGLHPEDRERVDKIVSAVLLPGNDGFYHTEYRTIGIEDGKLRWLDAQGQVFFDQEGKAIRLIGATIDITERKQAEKALAESEGRFRTAQELSPDGFLIFRPLRDGAGAVTDFLWIYENEAAARMNNTDPKEVLGKKVSEVLPHHDQSPFGKAYKEVAETGEVRIVEEAFYEQDTFQQRKWFRVVAVPSGGDVAVLVQDVTERKKAEAKLHEQRQFLRQIIDLNPNFIFAKDRDGRFTLVNKAVADTHGFTVDEMIGKLDADINPNKDEAEFFHRIDLEVIETLKPRLIPEERVTDVHGNVHWLQTVKIPIVGPDGKATHLLGASVDITDRKRAEEELRESEARFRDLANNISQLAWMADEKGWIFWYNQRWFDYTGTTLEEMEGWGWQKVHHPDYVSKITEEWQARINAGQPYDNVFPLRGKDGTYRQFLTRVTPIKDKHGVIRRWFGTNTDITEQREASERIRRLASGLEDRNKELDAERARWQGVVEGIAEEVWTCNVEGKISLINLPDRTAMGLEEFEDKSYEEVLQMVDITYLDGTVRPQEEAPLLKSLRTGEIVRGEEMMRNRNTGKIRYRQFSCAPTRDKSGTVTGAVAIVRDITDLKQAQNELSRLNKELEERIHERTAELIAANRELEGFSSSVSHDLRAPLRAIGGFSRALLDDAQHKLNEEEQHYLGLIVENTTQMSKLIENLLEFSRLGKKELLRQTVEMKVLAEELVKQYRVLYPDHPAKTSIGNLPPAQADPVLIRQVLENLISNAFKFTSKTRDPEIHIGYFSENGDPAAYFVRDNGAGFSMQYYDKLFGVFQRLHDAKEYDGTGIGLAFSKRIIQRHGGEMWAEGEVGKGATFFFSLPSERA